MSYAQASREDQSARGRIPSPPPELDAFQSQSANDHEVLKDEETACNSNLIPPASELIPVDGTAEDEGFASKRYDRKPIPEFKVVDYGDVSEDSGGKLTEGTHIPSAEPSSDTQIIDYGDLSEVVRGKLPESVRIPSLQSSESKFSDVFDPPKQEDSTPERDSSEDAIRRPSTAAGKSQQGTDVEDPCDRPLPDLIDIAKHHGSVALPYRHLFDTSRCWANPLTPYWAFWTTYTGSPAPVQGGLPRVWLNQLGMVRYHVNYMDMTQTGYFLRENSSSSASYDVRTRPIPGHYELSRAQIGTKWNVGSLIALIEEYLATWQDIDRARFMQRCIDAGVTDMIQLIESQQILYLGSRGETYIEKFPTWREPSLFELYADPPNWHKIGPPEEIKSKKTQRRNARRKQWEQRKNNLQEGLGDCVVS